MNSDHGLNSPGDEGASSADEPALVYDGDCPFCCWYVDHLAGAGGLHKINARTNPDVVRQLDRAHIDIDRDMALFDQGQLYKGADALCRLARREAAKVNGVSWMWHRLFRWRPLASVFYPLLRLLRIAYLRLSCRATLHATPDAGDNGTHSSTRSSSKDP